MRVFAGAQNHAISSCVNDCRLNLIRIADDCLSTLPFRPMSKIKTSFPPQRDFDPSFAAHLPLTRETSARRIIRNEVADLQSSSIKPILHFEV